MSDGLQLLMRKKRGNGFEFQTNAMMNKLIFAPILFVSLNSIFALWANDFAGRWIFCASLLISTVLALKSRHAIFDNIKTRYIYIILALYIILVNYFQSAFGGAIHYLSVDPAGHFDMCRAYSINFQLLNYQQSHLMAYTNYPISYYVNCGLLFDVFSDGSFISRYKVFVAYNSILYFLVCVLILSLLNNINSKYCLNYFVSAILIAGYFLEINLQGFLSQQVGLLLFLAYLNIVFIAMKNSQDNYFNIIIKVVLLSGIFLSYHYYIFQCVLLEIVIFYYAAGTRYELKKIIFVGIFAIALISPAFLMYLDSSKIISADGTIFRDLVSSSFILAPAFINFLTLADCIEKRFVRSLTMAVFAFSALMLIGVILGLVSPYYFFKNIPLIHICLALNFLVLFAYEAVWQNHLRIKMVLLVLFFCVYGYSPYVKNKLGGYNKSVHLSAFDFFRAKPQLDGDDYDLLNALRIFNRNKDSTCIASSDPVYLIWSTQITDGIFFRGDFRGNDAWSDLAWRRLGDDPSCSGDYKFIASYGCPDSNSPTMLYRNVKGCLQQF